MKISSIFNNIKSTIKEVIAFFKKKDVITVLFFLLFSFILWYMNTSSDDEIEKNYVIYTNYVGIPENIYIEEKLPDHIKYTLRGKRKELNKYKQSDTITINLSNYLSSEESKVNNKVDISFLEIINTFIAKKTSELTPTETQPLSFSSAFKILNTKNVPILLKENIKVESQYIFVDSIKIIPNNITILGPQSSLDTIQAIYVKPLHDTYNKSNKITSELIIPNPFVINTNNNVEISFLIDKSTEKSFDIPITLINVPENINIRTFPTSINIKFSVGIQNYNNVLPSMFEANIDYNTISNVSKTTQKVNIQYNSNIYITNLTSTPKEVEYVIETMQ